MKQVRKIFYIDVENLEIEQALKHTKEMIDKYKITEGNNNECKGFVNGILSSRG